jgi:hypothetical protein
MSETKSGDVVSPSAEVPATEAAPQPATGPATAPKKGPGRPRKKPVREPIERKGVAATPKREDNSIEFVYSEPMVFKRALSVFKVAAAKDVMFVFEADHIKIVGADHYRKSVIMVIIDGRRVPHYYCAERLIAPLNAKHLEHIIQMIDRGHTLINIICLRSAAIPAIRFLFQNETLTWNDSDEVKIMDIAPFEYTISDFDCTTHTLNFELPSTALKKLVTNAASILGSTSGKLTIQKVGTGPLTFSYVTADKIVNAQCIVESSDLIKLTSSTTEDDVFITSVQLDYIKPYATSLVAPTVRIFVDTTKKLVIASSLDGDTITIKAAVPIASSSFAS